MAVLGVVDLDVDVLDDPDEPHAISQHAVAKAVATIDV